MILLLFYQFIPYPTTSEKRRENFRIYAYDDFFARIN